MEVTSSLPMKKFTLRHEINCSVDQFWKVFFDKEFNNELFLKGLGFPEYEVLSQEETDTSVKRKIRGKPKMDVPKAVSKVLGDSFGYEENGSMDKSKGLWTWAMTPNRLEGKLITKGTVTVEAVGDDKCRRIATMEVEAKIFGVGKLIEKASETQMTDGWNKSATFMNKWLADHPDS
jgi:hypothetical protein